MAFHAATCPSCNGSLQVPDDRDVVKCMYCSANIVVRDAVTAAVGNGPTLEILFTLAKRSTSSGNSAEAFQLYSRILEREPNNVEALMGKGIAAGWCSTPSNMRFDEMKTYFLAAISAAPEGSRTALGVEACEAINRVNMALYEIAIAHINKFPSVDSAWNEFLDRIGTFVFQASSIASALDPSDRNCLKNIIHFSGVALQGISYTGSNGLPAYRFVDPRLVTLLQNERTEAVERLKRLEPTYEEPPLKVGKSGCLILLALLGAATSAIALASR